MRKPPTSAAGKKPSGLIEVFLQPGDVAVGDARHRIRTLLGSCVSVTLWCPLLRVGAMSHTLLASRAGVGGSAVDADARYGDEALGLMLAALSARGIAGPHCEAKIFGGGDMFASQKTGTLPAIGRRNGEAARELLAAHGIQIKSESLFGDGHRQILFDVASGDVWARQLAPGSNGAGAFSHLPGQSAATERSGA